MQLNNPKSNTSNLIKQSESAKKKARRRLIGSIFMLLTALIILLNVTTKVKPIPVDPKVIEISNNASAAIKASEPGKQIASAVKPEDNQAVAANDDALAGGFKGGVLSREEKTNASQVGSTTPVTPNPLIITMNIGNKPSPEDILNGNATTPVTIYYVQVAVSQNKQALQTIQTNLANNGIKTFIQNGKNNVFRLRIGPFKSRDNANEKLTQVHNSLNQ